MSGHLFAALWVKTMRSHVYLPGDIWPSHPLQRQREALPLIAKSSVMLSLLICAVPVTVACPPVSPVINALSLVNASEGPPWIMEC